MNSIYSVLQKFLNKIKYFLIISKKVLILNALYKQHGSKIRPNETLGLIFNPYCLIPSINFCWKLVVFCGITWIMWLYFVNVTNCPRTFGGHCILKYAYMCSVLIACQEEEWNRKRREEEDLFLKVIWDKFYHMNYYLTWLVIWLITLTVSK